MVLSFRRPELQSLLGVSDESRDGRKTDLMQRALSMVDRGISMSVETKIRDLYRKSGGGLTASRNSAIYSRRPTPSSTGSSSSSRCGETSLSLVNISLVSPRYDFAQCQVRVRVRVIIIIIIIKNEFDSGGTVALLLQDSLTMSLC